MPTIQSFNNTNKEDISNNNNNFKCFSLGHHRSHHNYFSKKKKEIQSIEMNYVKLTLAKIVRNSLKIEINYFVDRYIHSEKNLRC